MKHYLFIIFLLFLLSPGFCQKEANIWYFGGSAGLDFSAGTPKVLTGGTMYAYEGSAVVSDRTTGELLFYSNGVNVWNRNHQLMPHGRDYPQGCSTHITQSALIVPVPGQEHLYYLFTIDHIADSLGIYQEPALGVYRDYCREKSFYTAYNEVKYSLIDMRLEGGLGDVVTETKNVRLQTNSTEKLTAVPHSNGKDYWLLTHEWNSDAFYTYLLTAEGIAKPVITRIGSTHTATTNPDGTVNNDEIKGYMKASPDGTKLACAVFSLRYKRPFDLFDFDASTGKVSNYRNLGSLYKQYGLSFSADNSKLYVAGNREVGQGVGGLITQYDLDEPNAEAVIASGMSILYNNPKTNIHQYPWAAVWGDDFALQLGIDGKIYCAGRSFNNSIHNER